jgi:hypothetical protein
MMLECAPPDSYGQSWVRLIPTQWRYWVIETTRSDGLEDAGMASSLTGVELRCDRFSINLPRPEAMEASGQISGNPLCLFIHMKYGLPQPRRLDQAVLEDIRQIGDRLANLGPSLQPIRTAVEMYYDLADLGFFQEGRAEARLFVIGLFGVIESLITHDPKGGSDRLKHQIKAKMKLLNERFSTPLDYSAFGAVSSDEIWACLYSFRSAIAHGREPKFNGDHRVLKDERTAVEFLRNTAKTLLRHALQEPQLVLDLQAC